MNSRVRKPRAGAIANEDGGVIIVDGARANNLRSQSCSFERHRIVCVCGVSGSGKSSLLFSVLAAESQARHEALLANPRRKTQASRAPADAITGLPFSLTVSQRTLHVQKRSTIATQTGIHHDWVFLVSRAGTIRCPCGCEVGPPSTADVLTAIRRSRQKAVRVSAVVFRHAAGGTPAAVRHGGNPLKQLEDGGEWIPVPPRGSIEDALACASQLGEFETGPELESALATAAAPQFVGVLIQSLGRSQRWALDTSIEWPCPSCGAVHQRPTASLLSFNSAPERSGRCPACTGIGTALIVDLDRVIIDPAKPLLGGALGLERRAGSFRHISLREDTVRGVIRAMGASETLAWRRLPERVREAVLGGTAKREQPLDASGKKSGAKVLYHGLLPTLIRLAEKPGETGDYARTFAAERPCPACEGRRYDRARVARYEFGGKAFLDLLDMTAREARLFLQAVGANKNLRNSDESSVLARAIRKLEALDLAGLGHLQLGRCSATLSGGELQRLKISRSLAGGIAGACFILDEPSLGLHAADNEGMIRNLRALRDAGNTVILADHDPDFIAAADARVYLGPGAGHHGGRIIPHDLPAPVPSRASPKRAASELVTVRGCSLHNIRGQTISVPLGRLVCLTGVSGSGKSTFARGILVPALKAALAHGRRSGPAWTDISGTEKVRAVLAVEQVPLSRSRRSLVATYIGVSESIRALLADTEPARQREYRPAMFSSNRPDGWCPACSGLGVFDEEDASVGAAAPVCDACNGRRFRDAILDCQWRGKNIAEILDMEISDAANFFAGEREIARRLQLLGQLGLGHLKLGRPTAELSGGEGERLKLAAGIAEAGADGPTGLFFVLDEPTAGLHQRDVGALIQLIDRLLAGGRNTVVVIEHDMSVIRVCDHVIDFGPGSAGEGGRVVATGSPTQIASVGESRTGAALRRPASVSKMERDLPQRPDEITVPSVEEFARFSGFLNQHYAADPAGDAGPDGDEPARVEVRPTYSLRDTDFPPRRATVLEALRFATVLDELLRPSLRFLPESSDIVWVSEETLPAIAAKHCSYDVRIAWSLASDLASDGRATRSALPMLMRHAGETGARFWTDQTGRERAITDYDFRGSDPFHVRVTTDGPVDAAAIRRALQLGSGWACALAPTEKGYWEPQTHFINRPLSLARRVLAGRTLPTGLAMKRDLNACPFCGGTGEVRKCDETLICTAAHLSPVHPSFFTAGARTLLQPVAGRVKKTLEFFQIEGIADLLTPRKRWDARDSQLLWHGYPWARFPIPGRSSQKNVDFYEWRGLLPLVLDRLHLSKDARWRSSVEAVVATGRCKFCKGSGINWPAQHTVIEDAQMLDFLEDTTFEALMKMLEHRAKPKHALSRCVADACELGLGRIRIQKPCAELTPEERRCVRVLALRHAAFVEAGYLLPESDRAAFAPKPCGLQLTFQSTTP